MVSENRAFPDEMGVRGLATLVKQRGRTAAEELPSGTTLLIDGSGMVNFLLRGDRYDLGGDYGRLEALVTQSITRLQKAGYRITVYKDGDKRRMKAHERRRRLKQRRNEWVSLEDWAKSASGRPTVDFPRPVLASKSFYNCIKRLGVKIVDCEEEADQPLAKASGVVLADDSDFMVFRKCRYVPLEELEKLVSRKPVRIYDRESIAGALQLWPSSRLVDLAVLLQNDFTGHLAFTDYDNVDGLTDDVRRSPSRLLDWLNEQPPSWEGVSSLDRGVAFSRALYNLDSLDEFPLDEEDDDDDDGSPQLFPEDSDLEEDDDLPLPMGAKYALDRLSKLLSDDDDEKWDPTPLERLFRSRQSFRTEYAEAIALMLRFLEKKKKKKKKERLGVVDSPATFADVQAAYRYQKAILEGQPQGSMADIFDGPTFHAILVQQQAAEDDDEEEPVEEVGHAPQILPIDDHRDEILAQVARNRVTILIGETGSGKSSRMPMMLLEEDPHARMFVSQPRRIAARTLCDRVRSSLPKERKHEIGLRLGHGERDESHKTRLWFATTGYLVRLIASYPSALARHTHLIIDEVHERSVDGEVLCLLARRLVETTNIKVILMSATLCADLLASYFQTPEPHLFVGARRFQNVEFYAENVVDALGGMPYAMRSLGHRIADATSSMDRHPADPPSQQTMKMQYDLCIAIVDRVGTPRSSILIFVAGLNDIVELTERLGKLNDRQSGDRFFVAFPIHSDVPYEEQARVFLANDDPRAVRVVIATNAAESSVTIPDCDHVIDLGLAKQIEYDPRTHRQLLQTSWISQSSAIQRAGRTGRVRPGNVYRLYGYERFASLMRGFDMSDIHKTPLDSVVLNFYAMLRSSGKSEGSLLDESIADLLAETLEPPAPSAVDRAFTSLCDQGLLTAPNDDGELTGMGSFVSHLGLDLSLGRLVGLGAQLGVLDDAIILAAVLSQPQPPWRRANPLVHDDPDEYNAIVSLTFASRNFWDAGMRSEPISLIRMLDKYNTIKTPEAKRTFLTENGLVAARVNQLNSQATHLRKRVQAGLSLTEGSDEDIEEMTGDVAVDPLRLNKLRLLLTWTARDNLFRLDRVVDAANTVKTTDGVVRCKVVGPALTTRHVDSLRLPAAYSLAGGQRTHYTLPQMWSFFLADDYKGRERRRKLEEVYVVLETRLLELAFGDDRPGRVDCAWLVMQVSPGETLATLLCTADGHAVASDVVDLMLRSATAQRSRQGDLWRITTATLSKTAKKRLNDLAEHVACISVSLTADGTLQVTAATVEVQPRLHLAILLGLRPFDPAIPDFRIHNLVSKQIIAFQPDDQEEVEWHALPTGARYLSAMAGGYRDSKLRLWADGQDKERGKLEVKFCIPTPSYICCYGDRSHRKIFMADHTLAKTDVNLGSDSQQFGVAAAMLDIGAKLARADGVTLLPPGPEWLVKAQLAFGCDPDASCDLLDDDLDLIDDINAIASKTGESVAPCPDMARLLDHLFFPDLRIASQLAEVVIEDDAPPKNGKSKKKKRYYHRRRGSGGGPKK